MCRPASAVCAARPWSCTALSGYRRSWLSHDVVAGLVLVTLLVPQGMAYAELAGLPAITGLYASVTCLLAYAVVGRSRILVLGPDSALASMIAATIVATIGSGGSPPAGRFQLHAYVLSRSRAAEDAAAPTVRTPHSFGLRCVALVGSWWLIRTKTVQESLRLPARPERASRAYRCGRVRVGKTLIEALAADQARPLSGNARYPGGGFSLTAPGLHRIRGAQKRGGLTNVRPQRTGVAVERP